MDRRWSRRRNALILRAPRNATEARRPPRRGRGGASVRAGAPRAGLLSRLSRKGKRCLSGPQSVHASRGALFKPRDHADCSIPGVLFPGSCRPDCTLSHHTVHAMRQAPPSARGGLRKGSEGGTRVGDHPQICETRDRRPAGDPVVSDPSW